MLCAGAVNDSPGSGIVHGSPSNPEFPMNARPLIAALAIVLAGGAFAQPAATSEQREAMREKIKNMSPEEKAAAREKARARWESMTPEQQAAAKQRFAQRHPKAAERAKEQAASAPR
jgi:hypothetical protein